MRKKTILLTAAFVMSAELTGLGFSLIFHLTDRFGLTAGSIGFYLAVGYGTYILGCEVFRRFEPKVNIRICIPLSTMIMTICSLIIWMSPYPFAACAAWGILQGSTGFFWPPLMGWITRGQEGKKLNKDIGRFNQSWSIGGLLGPFFAGFLYARSPLTAFTVYITLFGVLTLFLTGSILIIKEMRELGAFSARSNLSAPDRQENTGGTPLRFPSWIGIFCAYAFLGVVINILPLEIRNNLGFTEQTAGNLLFVRGASSLAAFTIFGKITGWHYNIRWILLPQGLLVLLPFILLTGTIGVAAYILTLLLFGGIFASAYNNSIFHGCAGVENKGGRMAIHEGTLTAGAAYGSFFGGLFYQHSGVAGAVFFLAGTSLIGFSGSLLLERKQRRHLRT